MPTIKKVVVFGGGTGLSTLLRGLRRVENIDISCIVTVADDGGSTGRLTKDYNIPAVGDIRNVMVSLARTPLVMEKIMKHRFQGDSDLAGHNLGNLILAGLIDMEGNYLQGVKQLSKILNVEGKVIPVSGDVLTLYARMEDDTIVKGESNIPKYSNHINEVFYYYPPVANQEAIDAIKEADVIIFGIGSLYTSICPCLAIEEIKEEIIHSTASKIYVCNAMTQPGETDNYTVLDHINALEHHIGTKVVDTVVVTTTVLPDSINELYLAQGSGRVKIDNDIEDHHFKVIYADLVNYDVGVVRHDSDKVEKTMSEVLR